MIHIVGAWAGDPELLTRKGARLLAEADLILYAGSLINPEILREARPGSRRLDTAGMTLEEMVAACREAHARGREVVRLSSGDPCLYGATAELTTELDRHRIPWEIVPGVSSFQAAAAALGVEYTLPGVSQTLILTRMAGRTPVPPAEDLERLAAAGASMAIFLSADRVGGVVERLLAGGYAPDTPAAVVSRASWPEERRAEGTLADIAAKATAAGIRRTALILVGAFLTRRGERSRLYDPTFTHGCREARP